MKYIALIISLFLCGCATTKYYPTGVYVAEYQSNMIKYINTNNSNNLKVANRNWDMYIKARAQQVKLEKQSSK
jgi:hypothetical protein